MRFGDRLAAQSCLLLGLLSPAWGYDTLTFAVVPQQSATQLAEGWTPVLQNKINHTGTAPAVKSALIPIALHSSKASLTIQTPGSAVDALRAQLCAVCRGKTLYPCDKAEGWSSQCAFLAANSQ